MARKHRGFNGNLTWLSVIVLIVIQSVGVGLWAGRATEQLVNIEKTVEETKLDVKDNTERISYIEKLLQLLPKKTKGLLSRLW